jgi:hypothetical protein
MALHSDLILIEQVDSQIIPHSRYTATSNTSISLTMKQAAPVKKVAPLSPVSFAYVQPSDAV